jgi:flagellar protein FliT
MRLRLVEPVKYSGQAGVLQVRCLERELNKALRAEDWERVRRLDQSCSLVIDRVIHANESNSEAIAEALNELKGVYASLIAQCKREVASMAH